jgi:PTH1 family peptidyl-tRNA hydrolase
MAFRRKPSPDASGRPELLLVGLGNPGSEYSGTRHNLGFRCIDELARRFGVRVTQKQDQALVGVARHPGVQGSSILLVKPQTYMNLSGKSVNPLLRRHRLESSSMWALYDEMDLPFGRLRIRLGGGAGGHNGVHSLIQECGSNGFARFRMGVGRPAPGEQVDYLLSAFTAEERERVDVLIGLTCDAVEVALKEGMEIAMNRYNGTEA